MVLGHLLGLSADLAIVRCGYRPSACLSSFVADSLRMLAVTGPLHSLKRYSSA